MPDAGVPLLIRSLGELDPATPAAPMKYCEISVADTSIDERWLQQLLYRHPEVLPMTELDQAFAPVRSVARELATAVGPLDLLGVSPSGFLTIVETKLYRNPQSRREVLGQILDYCAQLTTWSYDDLVDAVRSAKHRTSNGEDPVLAAGCDPDALAFEERRFRATVADSLRHGRLLLMIVGDHFRDETQTLLDYVQRFMHLQFTVRLVELKLFRPEDGAEYPVLVVPRLVARTQEVTRAIVRLKDDVAAQQVVVEGVRDQRTTPALEQFFEQFRKAVPAAADDLATFLGQLQELGLNVDIVKTGIALRLLDPHGTGQKFRVLRVTHEGRIRGFRILKKQMEARGYDGQIALDYVGALATWYPNAHVNMKSGDIIGSDGQKLETSVSVLVVRRDDYMEAVKALLQQIKSAEIQKTSEGYGT